MFRPFEKEVIRTLVGDAIERDLLERVLDAAEIELDWTGIGYFATAKDPDLPSKHTIFHEPAGILGTGAGTEAGFIVIVLDGELTLECFGYGEDLFPKSFRDDDVALRVVEVSGG